MESLNQYITEFNRLYKAGNATEHSYRPALQILLQNIIAPLLITNEPKRIAREHYEVGKAPAIVYMKSSGVFVVHAEFVEAGLVPARKTVKESVTYVNGNIEHYIEF